MEKDLEVQGFTLIELLVVVAIISLLSSVVLASLNGVRDSAKVTRMASDFQQLERSLILWMQGESMIDFPVNTEQGGPMPNSFSLAVESGVLNIDEYLTSVPQPQFGDEEYAYYNRNLKTNDTSCSGGYGNRAENRYGMTIRIRDFYNDYYAIAQEIDAIIDGKSDMDCGKFRMYGSDAWYRISADGRL